MATINLGKVKGEPFRYEDFTPEQLAGLKGEPGETPIIKVGTVTTLEAGEKATVTAETVEETTTFNFGLPKGESSDLTLDTTLTTSGKAADAKATGDKIASVQSSIPTKTSQLTNDTGFKSSSDTVSEYDDIMANTVAGYIPDALAVKQGFQEVKDNLTKYNSNIHIVSDLLEEANKGANSIVIVEYSENTANTPYTAGLTGAYKAGMALLCMTGANYGQIIAFTAGNNQIFNRYKTPTGWSDWEEVNPQTNNAGSHNCIYRGRKLGDSVSEAQYAAIAAGTFDNMYIGDYWTINNETYRIAAFDYYYKTGDTSCTNHHVVLVPDRSLYTHVMNDTDVVTGAYVGSKMYTEGLNQAKEIINTAFGADHILSHRQLLYNTVNTGGFTTTAEWYDSTVELMNERNVYGTVFFSNQINGTSVASNYSLDKSQYPLFTYRPDIISNRNGFWLRDVAYSERFCFVTSAGVAGTNASSTATGGVRPAFCIC